MIQVGVEWFLSRTGSASSTHLETGGFVRSDPGVAHPNIQFHFLPSQVIDHGRQAPHLEAYQGDSSSINMMTIIMMILMVMIFMMMMITIVMMTTTMIMMMITMIMTTMMMKMTMMTTMM